MATIITVANQKGGPGKTTTAINVACGMAGAGYRMAVVDLDPQATLSKWNKKRMKLGLNGFSVQSVTQGMLEDTLQELRASARVDVVIVDCPGNIQDLTTRAVELSDAVLCPVRATAFDFEATKDISRFIDTVRQTHPDIRFMLFVNAKHVSRGLDKGAQEKSGPHLREAPQHAGSDHRDSGCRGDRRIRGNRAEHLRVRTQGHRCTALQETDQGGS